MAHFNTLAEIAAQDPAALCTVGGMNTSLYTLQQYLESLQPGAAMHNETAELVVALWNWQAPAIVAAHEAWVAAYNAQAVAPVAPTTRKAGNTGR